MAIAAEAPAVLLLLQFIYRLSFGLALAMAITDPRKVTSGYYRNHLYVLLGMNVLAALVAWKLESAEIAPLWLPVCLALLSYNGSVVWLYEQRRPGILILIAVSMLSLVGAWTAAGTEEQQPLGQYTLAMLDPPTAGLLLGSVLSAMLLGHWYLNAPGMQIAPLVRLIGLALAAVALRAVVSGAGLAAHLQAGGAVESSFWMMLALRWLAGVVGVAVTLVMAALTLRIPNTQSATGILYVSVIGAFIGELVAQLLSSGSLFPL